MSKYFNILTIFFLCLSIRQSIRLFWNPQLSFSFLFENFSWIFSRLLRYIVSHHFSFHQFSMLISLLSLIGGLCCIVRRHHGSDNADLIWWPGSDHWHVSGRRCGGSHGWHHGHLWWTQVRTHQDERERRECLENRLKIDGQTLQHLELLPELKMAILKSYKMPLFQALHWYSRPAQWFSL